jgi:hypothetical protein
MGGEHMVTPASSAVGRATGYSLVLPPGWCRIPVRHGSKKAVQAVVDQVLTSVPRNVSRDKIAPYRVELEGKLQTMVREARGKGGIDLYMPLEPIHGLPVSASFVVSEGTLGNPGEEADPVQVVAFLATQGGDGAPVEVDGMPAVRTEHTVLAEPAAEVEAGSRRVDYMIPVPSEQNRWLLAGFSTLGAGDPDDEFSGALVELFDAIMSTFKWTYGSR